MAASLYESFEEDYNNLDFERIMTTNGDVILDDFNFGAGGDEYSLSDLMVVSSAKEFEDIAVHLLKNPESLQQIKKLLSKKVNLKHGIFDSYKNGLNFLHSMESIAEIKVLNRGVVPNVVVCSKKLAS